MKENLKIGAIISYLGSLIFIGMGLHKMFVYENPEIYVSESKNSYVGGDAYNYIINANYATAYFTLAVFCAVIGMTFIISNLMLKDKINITKIKDNTIEENTIEENLSV